MTFLKNIIVSTYTKFMYVKMFIHSHTTWGQFTFSIMWPH